MSESLETIRNEFDRSQKRSLERRLKTVKRRHFLSWFALAILFVVWIVLGLMIFGVLRV